MIHRLRDPVIAAEIAKRQGIEADFSELMSEPMHICLADGGSMAFFVWRGPGIYELHLCFAARGGAARDLLLEMMEWMRGHHRPRMFWALIPAASRNVIMFARLMGWKSLGPRETRIGTNELFVLEERLCP